MPLRCGNTDKHSAEVSGAARIFAEYGDFIRSVIRYRVADEAFVDDLFQDFFLALISNPLPRDIRNIKGYLYKAITRDLIDAARRVERYRTRIYRYAERGGRCTTENTPESALIQQEEMGRMFELIEKHLRRSEAQAVLLRYRNRYTIEEIAAKLGVNSRSVSRYISKGLSNVRQFLRVR